MPIPHPAAVHHPALIDVRTGRFDLGQWVSRFLVVPQSGHPSHDPGRPSTVDGDPAEGKSDTLASMSGHKAPF